MNTRAVRQPTRQRLELIAEIIDDFCPRFFPRGYALYTRAGTPTQGRPQIDELASIDVAVRERDRLPDLVLYDPTRKWLLLIDLGMLGRVIDAHRHRELRSLFGASPYGLMCLTAFRNRDSFGKYTDVVAWETAVWIADEPDHLIQFDGGALHGP